MITAVIAERPSVAKDIANVLNVRERHDGYLSGNGYLVTWAFGHLVQLAMPEAYGYAGFRRENLPILPQEFKYIPRQIREGKEYKPDPGVLKQLKVIREVFDRSDRIVWRPMPGVRVKPFIGTSTITLAAANPACASGSPR